MKKEADRNAKVKFNKKNYREIELRRDIVEAIKASDKFAHSKSTPQFNLCMQRFPTGLQQESLARKEPVSRLSKNRLEFWK